MRTSDMVKKEVRNKKLAMCFIRRASVKTCGPILNMLRDTYLMNQDFYPKNLEESYALLQNHSSSKKKKSTKPSSNENRGAQERDCTRGNYNGSPTITGQTYYQTPPDEPTVAGADGTNNPKVKCYKCKKWGHYATNCPTSGAGEQYFQQNHDEDANEDEDSEPTLTDNETNNDPKVSFQHLMLGFMANENSHEHCTNSILLDTGSNISVFNNESLLTNIRASRFTQRVYTNGVHQDSTHIRHLPGFFDVWFNPESRLNILSFAEMSRKFCITMDTANESAIYVHIEENKVIKFKEAKNGLYVLNVNPLKTKTSVINYLSYFSSVTENKANFSKREIEGANKARKLYRHINMPGNIFFLHLVQINYFRNSPVTPDDVQRATIIYGPNSSFLKGKSTRKRPNPIENIQIVHIPPIIKQYHTKIVLSVNYMIVQNIAMLFTIDNSFQYCFLKLVHKKKANKNDILKGINQIINVYKARNIEIKQIHVDNEFECIREDVRPSIFNTVAAEEHVGIIERAIRTNKDDTRCHIHRLLYTHYPIAMVEGAQTHSIHRRNNLPAINGVSQELSPQTLITGLPPPDYNEIVKLNFGDYVQTYEGETKNTNKSRHIGAIALFPSPSGHGSRYFMSLLAGKRIHRNSWTVLPATEDVIQRVNQLAREQGQGAVDANLKYEWGTEEDFIDEDNVNEGANTEPIDLLNEHEELEPPEAPSEEEEERVAMEVREIELSPNVITAENENEENTPIDLDNVGEEIQETEEEINEQELVEEIEEGNENEDTNVEETNTQESETESANNDDGMNLRRGRRIDYASLHRTGISHMNVKGATQFMKKVKRIDKHLKKKRIIIKDMFKKVVVVTMAHIKSAAKHEQVSMREGI